MEQTFFKVSVMGGYMNHGLPMIVPQPNVGEWPTPQRKNWEYRSLATLQDHHIKHDGRAEWMADFYRLGTSVFLVSDKVLQLILERDPKAVEMRQASIKGDHASEIGPYWVVMPLRVFDAVDISKSSVLLKRPELLRGTGKFVTHINYGKGYVIRDDLPPEVCCFCEEFKGNWYWHRDLIQAAAAAGARGLHFGFQQVDRGREMKLRGPNDPSEY
jgi:hypothetical protein